MNYEPIPPTHEETHKWDSARFALRQLVAEHQNEACRAGKALAKLIQAKIDEVNAKNRKGIKKKLALLPIARDFVLDREAMEAPSEYIVDLNNPPPGLSLNGINEKEPLPVWIERVFKAVGRFNVEVRRTFMNLVGHLKNAQNGRIGDYSIEMKIDLRITSAIDAYVHSMSELSSQGNDSPDDVRASLDPDNAEVISATDYWAFGQIMLEFLRENPAKIRTMEDWWMIAVAVLVCSDPEFDPITIGIKGMPLWQEDKESQDYWKHFYGTRSGFFDHFHDFAEYDAKIPEGWQRRFWLLAERVIEHINQVVKNLSEKAIEQKVIVNPPCRLTVKGLTDWIGISVKTFQIACDNADVKRASKGKGRVFKPHEVSQVARQRAKSTKFDDIEKNKWEKLLCILKEPSLDKRLKARSK